MPLSEKGDLLVAVDRGDARSRRAARRRRLTRSGTPASGSSPARVTGSTSTSASAAPGRAPPPSASTRPSAAPIPAYGASTAPAAGSWCARSTCSAHAARLADEAQALLSAPAVPGRRDHADPRRRADGAADPRVGRARHRARPDPRLGGGVRRHQLARPRPAGLAALRLAADEHHRRRRRCPGALGSFGFDDEGTPAHRVDIVQDGIWVGVLVRPRLGRRGRPRPAAAASAPTASTGCRWCG